MATTPTDAINRINAANGNAYDVTNNPGGLAQGGHRQNFVPDLQAAVSVAQWSAASAGEAATSATATAADRVQTGQDRTATGQARDKANLWANAPEDQEVETGKFSAFHFMRKAMAQVGLATTQADRSTTQADRSQGYAQGLNIPALNSSTALQFLRANAAGNSYEFAAIDTYSASLINRRARTSNVAIVKSNKGDLIDYISGTFAQDFSTVSSLGAGWFAYFRNSGTGDITITPNGATIDGLTSFIMYPGEARLVQCDGTALRSIVLEGFTKVFAASDNFIKPPGYSQFGGILRSGGAGGSFNSTTAQRAEGGPGGGAFPFNLPATALASSTPVVIGAGGAGGTVSGAAATPGGDSTFAGISVSGGGNGVAGLFTGGAVNGANSISAFAADFGPSAVNQLNGKSLYGGGSRDTNNTTGAQGASIYGGGCGGLVLGGGTSVSPAGISTFAGAGGSANGTGSGGNGAAPSGGGGGSRVSPAGAGARGQLDIWGLV